MWVPNQGLNPYPLHWKAKSDPLGCQRSPISIHFKFITTRLAFLKGSGHMLCSMHVCLIIMKVLVIQSCPTVCDPMDCSLPVSSVRGIHQARILELVAIPFFRVSSQPRDRTWVSCSAGRFFSIWAALLHLLAAQCSEGGSWRHRRKPAECPLLGWAGTFLLPPIYWILPWNQPEGRVTISVSPLHCLEVLGKL